MDDDLSGKAKSFIDDLRDLCRRHGVSLSVSGYDALQIWPMDEGSDPIHSNGIVDKTRSGMNS